MSKELSKAAKSEFDSQVKHAYQATANPLRATARVKAGINASRARFNKMGKGQARRKTAPSVDVVPMNVGHDNVWADLEDWSADEYTDIFDQAKTDVNERRELAFVLASAINRRERQIQIDALDAVGTGLTVAAAVGGNTALNSGKILKGNRLLNDQGVPGTDRHWVGSYEGQEQLLSDDKATSSDFATMKALAQGKINEWQGISFHWIEEAAEGGLGKAGNDRQNFLYHGGMMGTMCLATGQGIDKRSDVGYVRTKKSWLSSCDHSAGATIRDALGVVEITTTEAA